MNLKYEDNFLLGKIIIRYLPKRKAGECKFAVEFFIDFRGTLTITSYLLENRERSIELNCEDYKGCVSKNEYFLI